MLLTLHPSSDDFVKDAYATSVNHLNTRLLKRIESLDQHEKHLIENCLKGDQKAQRTLYNQFKVPMFRLCLRYAKNRAEAEDLLQEGFIKVFGDLPNYRGEGALGGWIRRLMINVALQHLRKQKEFFQHVQLDQVPDQSEDAWNESEQLFIQNRAKALTQMIQHLPAGYRTVFNLYVIEGYTHREIATALRISENTSKSQLSKAKAMLRKKLEESMIT